MSKNKAMEIRFTHLAKKQLHKCPQEIQAKVADWLKRVLYYGILTVRLTKSYHDEPLKGKRKGQRSIRLNKQWRLIYEEQTGEIIEIQEVSAHDYRTR